MRVSTYAALPTSPTQANEFDDIDSAAISTVRGAIIDLDLWTEEWSGLMTGQNSFYDEAENHSRTQNMHIQHAWALMTLHCQPAASKTSP